MSEGKNSSPTEVNNTVKRKNKAPGREKTKEDWRRELTPREIVKALDKYIIGQDQAKKSVAIALRNRWRRQHVDGDLKEEIMPNNIIMIGPTGVGKTEIARRLANLADAPLIKVEASKYTEVGYVGRDVESMVRELTDLAVNMIKREKAEAVQQKARSLAEEKILDLLLPPKPQRGKQVPQPALSLQTSTSSFGESQSSGFDREDPEEKWERTREKLRVQLKQGKLDKRTIEMSVPNDRFTII